MAPSSDLIPSIDIELSLSPQSHSFADPSPPTITLKLISHANSTLTLVITWGCLLDLRRALITKGFIITDQTTGQLVPTSSVMTQRFGNPIRRIRGTSDEDRFITLEPNQPITLSRPFGRNAKPQPKDIVKRGWELDDQGNEVRIRRSVNAAGVDGLEPGHQYLVALNPDRLKNLKWAYATKDQVLVNHKDEGSLLDDYPWQTTPIHFNTTEVLLSVLGLDSS